jgi:hypothetical protein
MGRDNFTDEDLQLTPKSLTAAPDFHVMKRFPAAEMT